MATYSQAEKGVLKEEIDVRSYPHSMIGIEAGVPISIELPLEVYATVKTRYDDAAKRGKPDFADFLCDVIVYEPTFTVGGHVIDEHTGAIDGVIYR